VTRDHGSRHGDQRQAPRRISPEELRGNVIGEAQRLQEILTSVDAQVVLAAYRRGRDATRE
jgi:hypothetical protein